MPLFRDGAQRASRHHSSPSGNHHSALRSLLVRGAVAAGLGLLLTAHAAGLASAHEQSSGPRVRTALKAGQKIADHGLTLSVPARGQFTWGEMHHADGTVQELLLETDTVGRVFATSLGDERVIQREQEAAALSAEMAATPLSGADATVVGPRSSTECGSHSYYSYSWRIPSYKWYLNSGSIPSYLRTRSNGTATVLSQIKYAAGNITGADNACGRGDYLTAYSTFLGYTSRSNNISTGGSCTGGDGYSVVNFGYLPSGVLGMACAYGWSGGYAREGDVRLNLRARWETMPGWCSSETLIQAAITHEFGHVYGLGHVYGSPQTMNPYIPNCSMAPTTLGMGDLLGFERKY